ncbi:MAG: hypothetical protein IK068_00715, partial [Lachnospiraceae bacterium]|nr:hypothetical protein [Lachnospiraceae bacterium]
MKDPIDDALNSIMGKRQNYTEEEINRATARKKRYGGTLFENLEAVTGRSFAPSIDMDAVSLQEEINAFSKELNDYKEDNQKKAETSTVEVLSTDDALSEFAGVSEKVKETVFGQDDFIKKLIISFKRPFILSPEGTMAKNTIYITGKKNTGKHLSLRTLVKALREKRILKSDLISEVDLSLYQSADQEKLFLQDLYSALNSKSEVILFENFEQCHSSMAARLFDLVTEGKVALNERYVNQNGQLINVPNALSGETVGALYAKDKYLVIISDKSLEKLADKFGALFINALGDIVETDELNEEAIKSISLKEMDELKEVSEKKFKFKLEASEEIIDYSVSLSGKGRGLEGVLSFYDDCLKALAQIKLEGDYPVNTNISLSLEDNNIVAKIGEEDKK